MGLDGHLKRIERLQRENMRLAIEMSKLRESISELRRQRPAFRDRYRGAGLTVRGRGSRAVRESTAARSDVSTSP